jgi:hypothetical protein
LALQVDELAAEMGLSRSAFVRAAVLAAVEAERPELSPVPDRAELLRILTTELRAAGSVGAARVLLDELRHDPPGRPASAIDDLIRRRKDDS